MARIHWVDEAAATGDAGKGRLSKRIFPTSGGIPHFATISPDGMNLAYVINLRGQVAIRLRWRGFGHR